MNLSSGGESINYGFDHGNIMSEKIHHYDFVDEIRICPLCGYADGFHNMFRREGRKTHWFLICSSCHEVFDYGLEYKA